MKEFIFKIFKMKEKYLYLSIILLFFLISFHHLNSGFYMSSDSYKFSSLADNLIELNFNLYHFYFSDSVDFQKVTPFFFTIPAFLIALCKIIFLDKWQHAFLILNLIFVFFSIIIFTKILLNIGVRSFLIFLNLPLILMSVDVLTWPRYILADMNYAFLVILITYFITKGFVENKFNYLVIFLILFLILLTRPTSISIIFAVIFFFTIMKYQIFLKHKAILFFILTLFITVPLVFGILYYCIKFQFTEITQLEWLPDSLYPISMVKSGMIIHERPETWVDVPSNFKDIAFVYFLRLVYFFNPYAATFSINHNILNIIQTFFIFLSIFIWSFFGGVSKIKDKTFFLIIILSISVAAFHSFTLIDYDWRYRFPIILPLLMLFPISLEIILRKYKL